MEKINLVLLTEQFDIDRDRFLIHTNYVRNKAVNYAGTVNRREDKTKNILIPEEYLLDEKCLYDHDVSDYIQKLNVTQEFKEYLQNDYDELIEELLLQPR